MATLSTRPNNQNFIPTSSNPSFPSSDINQHHDSSSYGYSDSTSGAEDKNGDTNTATDTYADNTAAFSDVSDRGGLAPSNSNPNSTNFATSTLPAHSPVRPSLGSAAPYSPDSLAVGNSNSPLPPTLLHVSFNQDYGCFAAGTDRGFRIYNCDPFREIFRRDFQVGRGIGKVEMLYRYNILALVGGGPDPQYPVNKVMVWDDHQSRCIGELAFRSEVRGVRLRRDRIVVVLDHKVYVYNFADLKLLHQIETIANPKGLCEVSQTASNFVLVCPGLQKGQVRVEHYASKRTKFIMAHDSRVACFALNQDGSILATASSKGTLIRIFKTLDGTLLQEVRRGVDRAEIYSLAFSPSAQWLGVSSDKGTIHVFNLKINSGTPYNESMQVAPEASPPVSPSGSPLSSIKGAISSSLFSILSPRSLDYEETSKSKEKRRSVAQFHLMEGAQYIVAFGHQKNTVIILGLDGSFYRCQFDPVKGGKMTQLEYHNFLKPEEE